MHRAASSTGAALAALLTTLPLSAAPRHAAKHAGHRVKPAAHKVKAAAAQTYAVPDTFRSRRLPDGTLEISGDDTHAAASPAPPPRALTGPEREALRLLRRLRAATAVGVNRHDYEQRLIDTKADVEEQVRAMRPGPARDHITAALRAYQDAQAVWDMAIKVEFKNVFQQSSAYALVQKYHSPYIPPNDPLEKFGSEELSALPSGMWEFADREIAAADGG